MVIYLCSVHVNTLAPLNSPERPIGNDGRGVFYLCSVHVNTLAPVNSPERLIGDDGRGVFTYVVFL